jgi:hypothetical protein
VPLVICFSGCLVFRYSGNFIIELRSIPLWKSNVRKSGLADAHAALGETKLAILFVSPIQ